MILQKILIYISSRQAMGYLNLNVLVWVILLKKMKKGKPIRLIFLMQQDKAVESIIKASVLESKGYKLQQPMAGIIQAPGVNAEKTALLMAMADFLKFAIQEMI